MKLSVPISILIAFSLLSLLLHFSSHPFSFPNSSPIPLSAFHHPPLKIFVADLPRSFNYGLLDLFWSLKTPDSRIPNPDPESKHNHRSNSKYPPYPDNPLIRQYSAEYWLLGDLETPQHLRSKDSAAVRVFDPNQADVIFVPFFATLSAEMQLGWSDKNDFRKKDENINFDYKRQKEVLNIIKGSQAWKRSGGHDHVFVLTDPVAMWHVKDEIAPAILLVVDFGGWYRLDSHSTNVVGTDPQRLCNTKVSTIKDVIVPYTHLLPTLHISGDNEVRSTLLYFKGAKHRQRGGRVREKLWEILENESGVIMEQGFPNSTGREQSIKGMRSSQFCLHPAGDTPTSCRLFDAIASLCIPVVVSDTIVLPFKGIINYSEIALFVSESRALQPKYLVNYLRGISGRKKESLRTSMARVQNVFEFENDFAGGVGPISSSGTVNHVWEMVYRKSLMLRDTVLSEEWRPDDVKVPLRCHCA